VLKCIFGQIGLARHRTAPAAPSVRAQLCAPSYLRSAPAAPSARATVVLCSARLLLRAPLQLHPASRDAARPYNAFRTRLRKPQLHPAPRVTVARSRFLLHLCATPDARAARPLQHLPCWPPQPAPLVPVRFHPAPSLLRPLLRLNDALLPLQSRCAAALPHGERERAER
jgi:hypothetical protein